jgi:cell division topological specificity factor MinE
MDFFQNLRTNSKTKEMTDMGLADFFRKKSSSNVAKDRLKMVLVSDRANCSPDIMEQIKKPF